MNATLEQVEASRRNAANRRLPPIRNPQSAIPNSPRSSSNPGAVDPPDAGRRRGHDDGSSKVGPARDATVCCGTGLPTGQPQTGSTGHPDLVEETLRRRMKDIRSELGLVHAAIRTYGSDRWPLVAVQSFLDDCEDKLSAIRKRVAHAINEYPPVVIGYLPD